jgi:glycosyltransferase involved in cell wall biosynthesis
MKLLVFAHVPPPHHGQSYMVQLLLNGFGGDCRKSRNKSGARNGYGIDCYHVDARFSKSLADIGELQIGKVPLILFYCLQAIWCRFRYGVTNFYYVPAPGKSVALYRDWLVLFICRPFFKNIILHWHAAGLAKWLETSVQIRTRAVTYHAFKQPALSVVISKYNVADAEKLLSRRIRLVNYGIPDPCRDFGKTVLPRRKARFAARAKLLRNEPVGPADLETTGGDPQIVKVLYLAHYMREKGLFAAAQAVVLANQILTSRKCPVQMKLLAAGTFVTDEEKLEFDGLLKKTEFAGAVDCLGFVSGLKKEMALREADLFCFPTRYSAENQPVTLIEAMAFGLPIVTTHWRSIPEMFPPGYPGLVADQSTGPIADALLALMTRDNGEYLREHFLSRFTLERHLANLAEALRSVETAEPTPAWEPAVQNSQTATPHKI